MSQELFDACDAAGYDAWMNARRRLAADRDRALAYEDPAALVLEGVLAAAELERQPGDSLADPRLLRALLMMDDLNEQHTAVDTVRGLKAAADAGDPVLAALCAEVNRAALFLDATTSQAADELDNLDTLAGWPGAA